MTSPQLLSEAVRLGVASPASRREWEDVLVLRAAYFTCSVPSTDPRPRGQRMQWMVSNYPTLRDASDAVLRCGPRALVYAVSASGDSAPLARADWDRYLRMRGEL